MANAKRDGNRVPTLIGVDKTDATTPRNVAVSGTTGAMLVESSLGLSIPEYDYVSMALSVGDTTETYTFKDGGSGGTTVATVVIVYTSSTRSVLSTVTKT